MADQISEDDSIGADMQVVRHAAEKVENTLTTLLQSDAIDTSGREELFAQRADMQNVQPRLEAAIVEDKKSKKRPARPRADMEAAITNAVAERVGEMTRDFEIRLSRMEDQSEKNTNATRAEHVRRLENKVEQLAKENHEFRKEIQALRTEICEAKAEISSLKVQMKSAQQETNTLKEGLDEKIQSFDARLQALTQANTREEDLGGRVDSSEASAAEHGQQLAVQNPRLQCIEATATAPSGRVDIKAVRRTCIWLPDGSI